MQTRVLYLVAGTLSAVLSSFAGADVPVSGNLTMTDSTDSNNGNILKGGVPFIHNYGPGNTFIGKNAGNFTMTGIQNTACGGGALMNNTTGAFNTASGAGVLLSNDSGSQHSQRVGRAQQQHQRRLQYGQRIQRTLL
jgi:hypothetical protein